MALYSIVVPVYNSETMLPLLYKRISNVFENIIKEQFEIIFVDDCSIDNSYRVICELRKKDSRVKGIQLAVNHGQQKAVMCGFSFITGDYVITMDDDLQHPPEEIPKLIYKMNSSNDIDVVIGSYDSKKHGPIKIFGTKMMDLLSDLIYRKPRSLSITSFRLIKRYVIDNLNNIAVSRPMIGPLILQTTKRIVNVTVQHDERYYGKSGYSFIKLCRAFFDNMITNSDLPLKAIGWVGLISFLISIILVLKFVLDYFIHGTSFKGWTSTIVVILFFGGVILFAIGILGRYLTSIMLETKKYPKFLVRRKDIDIDNESIRR